MFPTHQGAIDANFKQDLVTYEMEDSQRIQVRECVESDGLFLQVSFTTVRLTFEQEARAALCSSTRRWKHACRDGSVGVGRVSAKQRSESSERNGRPTNVSSRAANNRHLRRR